MEVISHVELVEFNELFLWMIMQANLQSHFLI